MTFYRNVGYRFALDKDIKVNGGIILSSGIASHTLERREFKKYSYLNHRLIDPQVYMKPLDPNQSKKECANLASYNWFEISRINDFDSDEMTQSEWNSQARSAVSETWNMGMNGNQNASNLFNRIESCIDFQIQLGFEAIILPSVLSFGVNLNIDEELHWLDVGLEIIKNKENDKPVYFSLAINDSCLRTIENPTENQFLSIILDNIFARDVDGIYFTIELESEDDYARYIENENVIKAALFVTDVTSNIIQKDIIVNYFGPFGVLLSAMGAKIWASDWYKSLVRLRLRDHVGEGRAYPSYWSFNAMTDIHLEKDFQILVDSGLYDNIKEITKATKSIDRAVNSGVKVVEVPAWTYRMGNITATKEHYLRSMVNEDLKVNQITKFEERLRYIEEKLDSASDLARRMDSVLSSDKKTRTTHIYSWRSAFKNYISSQPFRR